jgi:hypothetical protein
MKDIEKLALNRLWIRRLSNKIVDHNIYKISCIII